MISRLTDIQPTWSYVLACFSEHKFPERALMANVRFAARKDGVQMTIRPSSPMRLDYWTHTAIGEAMQEMGKLYPFMVANDTPRMGVGATIMVHFGDNRYWAVDGRRRANKRKQTPGLY